MKPDTNCTSYWLLFLVHIDYCPREFVSPDQGSSLSVCSVFGLLHLFSCWMLLCVQSIINKQTGCLCNESVKFVTELCLFVQLEAGGWMFTCPLSQQRRRRWWRRSQQLTQTPPPTTSSEARRPCFKWCHRFYWWWWRWCHSETLIFIFLSFFFVFTHTHSMTSQVVHVDTDNKTEGMFWLNFIDFLCFSKN